MTRIIISDDHQIILSGADALLENSDYEIVATAVNGAEALIAVEAERPDILVVDVSMPVCSGLDVLRILRAKGNDLPVILLTAGIDRLSAQEAMRNRVNGMVLKTKAAETFLACLDAVRDGGFWIDPGLQSLVNQPEASAGQRSLRMLSERESAVAALAVRGLRNREIATELGITEGTVKLHLHKIYEKLGIGSRTELVILARDWV